MKIVKKIKEYVDNGVKHRMETVEQVPSWYNHCFNVFFGSVMIAGTVTMVLGAVVAEWGKVNMAGEMPISHKDEVIS